MINMFNDKSEVQNNEICLYCKFYRELNEGNNDTIFIENLHGRGICYIDEHLTYPEEHCDWWVGV